MSPASSGRASSGATSSRVASSGATASAVRARSPRSTDPRQRAFTTLLLSETVSLIGDRLVALVLVTLVYQRTGSAAWVAALMMCKAVPAVALGTLAGVVADRWPRRRIMVTANLVQGLLVLAIPSVDSVSGILAVYLVMSVVNQFFLPARAATIPSLVGDDALPAANAKFAGAFVAALALGPVLGGVLTEHLGYAAAFYVDALTFLVPALAVASVDIPHVVRHRMPTLRADSREGLALLRTDSGIRAALIGTTAAYLVIGTMSVTGVVLAQQAFHTGPTGFGLMMSSLGMGMLVGAVTIGRAGAAWRNRPLIPIGLAAAGAATLGLAFVQLLPLALPLSLAMGVGLIATQVRATTTLQSAPPELRGRALGLNQVATGVAQIAATVLSAWGTTSRGATVVIAGVGGLAIIVALALRTAAQAPNRPIVEEQS